MCGGKTETAMHLASACPKMAQKEYLTRHDKVAARVHWELCRKHGLESTDKWYEHVPSAVEENEDIIIKWELEIRTDKRVKHNRPDITLIDKKQNQWTLVDIAVPADYNVVKTEDWKVEKYQDLTFEIRKIHKVTTEVVPIIIGAFGTVPKRFQDNLKRLCLPDVTSGVQITAILGTAGILRRTLNRE